VCVRVCLCVCDVWRLDLPTIGRRKPIIQAKKGKKKENNLPGGVDKQLVM